MILFRTVLILSLSIFAAACSSSEPEKEQQPAQQPEFPNLMTLNPPEDQEATSSKVYVDSVQLVDYKQEKVLLISGNLANGCTYLRDASHTVAADSLQLTLTAWKPADKMCTQALVPFSFIYDGLTSEEIETHSEARVNRQAFKIDTE